jgi:hypothetical protein
MLRSLESAETALLVARDVAFLATDVAEAVWAELGVPASQEHRRLIRRLVRGLGEPLDFGSIVIRLPQLYEVMGGDSPRFERWCLHVCQEHGGPFPDWDAYEAQFFMWSIGMKNGRDSFKLGSEADALWKAYVEIALPGNELSRRFVHRIEAAASPLSRWDTQYIEVRRRTNPPDAEGEFGWELLSETGLMFDRAQFQRFVREVRSELSDDALESIRRNAANWPRLKKVHLPLLTQLEFCIGS